PSLRRQLRDHCAAARLRRDLGRRRHPRRVEHVLCHRGGRRRELALLRCLGASRGQMYGSVVAEGLFVGLLGSVFGVLAGIGGSRGLMLAAGRYWPEEFPYDTLTVPVSALLTGIGVGALLTILATIRPARSAIAVTPLEALQPFDVSFTPSTRNRPRQII